MIAAIEVQPVQLINISDELSRAKAYLECVYLAAESALENEHEHANAILSVLTVAQNKIGEVVKSVDALYSEHSAKAP